MDKKQSVPWWSVNACKNRKHKVLKIASFAQDLQLCTDVGMSDKFVPVKE
jgi:hypothetical protein